MLAVVVDDHDMNITHVIRGDDHFTNTFRQVQIYNGMGWEIPKFAHLPLILGPDGHKLSKRHGAVGTAQYREDGYLAVAMRNYLLRLGWSHGDQEFFTDEEAIKLFDIKDVGRSPARFDFAKLCNVNNHYMRLMPVAELAAMLKKPKTLSDNAWLKAVDLFRERAKTLIELQQAIDNLVAAHAAPIADEAKPHLAAIANKLSGNAAAIDQMLKDYVVAADIPFKLIGQNIRIALTGEANAPAIGKLIEILGAEESARRIRKAAK
jgi:glutamyl-tRNA synthetase